MRSLQRFETVEVHTAGSPVRVVTSGMPTAPGASVAAKREWLVAHADHLRTLLMYEPRGHAGMSGSVIVEPCDPRADVGVVFMEVSGWLPMCGHGTIGTVTALLETGIVPASEPVTEVVLDTPAGLVRVVAQVCDGVVTDVAIENVPSYLHETDVKIEIPGWGHAAVDVAFGGNFYAIVDAASLGISIRPSEAETILTMSRAVKKAITSACNPVHPRTPWIQGVSHVMLTSEPTPDEEPKNVVFYGEAGIARDPCGTGTSARMAQRVARGDLKVGERFTHQGILGTRYIGHVKRQVDLNGRTGVINEVSGAAHVIGSAQFTLAPDDPFPRGFGIGYGSDIARTTLNS